MPDAGSATARRHGGMLPERQKNNLSESTREAGGLL
jgi:hypothetical protein